MHYIIPLWQNVFNVKKITALWLQDISNKFYSASSDRERGTMSQLKAYFNHRNVSNDVMNCFNHADDFIRFIAESHVIYMAMHKLGIRSTDDLPSSSLYSDFNQLCRDIVNTLWLFPSQEAIQTLMDIHTDDNCISSKWCICNKG